MSSEREPLADVTTTDKEVRVVVEMPGISKENIKTYAYGTSVEVSTTGADRKYHEVIDLQKTHVLKQLGPFIKMEYLK